MIASLFRKSTPFNYTLLISLVLVFFLIYQGANFFDANSQSIIAKAASLALVFGSLFIQNFIVKKNHMSRDNSFAILFFFLFVLFFPALLDDVNLLISNFFILLALRRLISLHSPKTPKEKIFDASLWVFAAALFHFWAILFMILVFVSILFHAARDYRNWILPFLAAAAAVVTFSMFALIFDPTRIDYVFQGMHIDVSVDYFTKSTQNVALSLFASVVVFFVASMLLTLSGKPLIVQSSYKKVIWAFFIGLAVFVISPNKSNELLVYLFSPLAIMAATQVEYAEAIWQREAVTAATALLAIVCFFIQL